MNLESFVSSEKRCGCSSPGRGPSTCGPCQSPGRRLVVQQGQEGMQRTENHNMLLFHQWDF
ncbi:unnamed protein product [Amoebophrya sp. A25]|nr:unnamed protein product [Amoebophrya sp. A25]|eukprot:GSA25T00001391001.1